MKQLLILSFIVIFASCSTDSSEIFNKYIKQYLKTTKLIEIKNDNSYRLMEDIYLENPSKTQKWFTNTQEIRNKTNIVKCKIDSLIELSKLELKNKFFCLNKVDVEALKKDIANLNEFYLSLIKDKRNNAGIIASLNEKFAPTHWAVLEVLISKELKSQEYFATMLKLKLDLTINQNTIYQHQYYYIGCGGSFGFSNTEIFVIPNAQIIKKGSSYKAEILLASYDTSYILNYEIDRKKHKGNNGKIVYETKINENPGLVKKSGGFIIHSFKTGKDSIIPFTIEYEVLGK